MTTSNPSPAFVPLVLSIVRQRRAEGKNAVARVAYVTGEELLEYETGITHRRGKGGVVASGLCGASDECGEQIWNAAEESEGRDNSIIGREVMLALPGELPLRYQIEVTRLFAAWLAKRFGTPVAWGLHAAGDFSPNNPHLHVFMPTREYSIKGFGKKLRELDKLASGSRAVAEIRREAAKILNQFLSPDRKVTATRIPRRWTAVHLGSAAHRLEARGISTSRGDHNRLVERLNAIDSKLEMLLKRRAMERDAVEALQQPPLGNPVVPETTAVVTNAAPVMSQSTPQATASNPNSPENDALVPVASGAYAGVTRPRNKRLPEPNSAVQPERGDSESRTDASSKVSNLPKPAKPTRRNSANCDDALDPLSKADLHAEIPLQRPRPER